MKDINRFIAKRHTLIPMKTYIEKNEIAALFFLHYFKYTRFAFKKQKSETDKASIHAHRELMRLFGMWHNEEEGRVPSNRIIASLTSQIHPSTNPFVTTVSAIMKESIEFIYDQVLMSEEEQRLLERYA